MRLSFYDFLRHMKVPSDLQRWCARTFAICMGLTLLVALGSCASNPPGQQDNICAVFAQKGSWHKSARKAERRWGMPVHVGMAFLHKESSYVANAKPPRRRILGLVPWTRLSSAYGYAQATDEAWQDYERDTTRWFVDRDDFSDAIDFVGWYNARSAKTLGIARRDAYHLYLAYYSGVSGYRNGHWKRSPRIQDYARRVAAQAARYETQLKRCS